MLELENERLHVRLGEKPPEQLALEWKALEEQIEAMQRRFYGDSSERREYEKPPKETTQPRQVFGRTSQARLPHLDTRIELAEDEGECPFCAGTLEEMGDPSEDTEVIDVIRRQFVVRRIRRQKYRCKCQSAIVVAPPSAMHAPRGRYTLDFGAYVLTGKYGGTVEVSGMEIVNHR